MYHLKTRHTFAHMLEPHKQYRKFRAIVQWYDESTHKIEQTRKTLDLGSVQDFEELNEPNFNDGKKRIYVRYTIGIPPQIFLISYEEFDKVFTDYLEQTMRIDQRSVKKNYNYYGFTQSFMDPLNIGVNGVPYDYFQGFVFKTFPRGYNFNLATQMEAADAMLSFNITPYN